MIKLQWIFLLCLLASCGADNNQQNSEPAQGLRQIPKNPYAIQWADTLDIFVWRVRLLDTLGNVLDEQHLIEDMDTTFLKSNVGAWLGNAWDTIQLPRVQLLEKRTQQPRAVVIELWEDSLHSLRKQIEIPAGHDGVAFEILRPAEKRVIQTITIKEPIVSVWEDLKRVDILERDSMGVPTKGRAVYYIKSVQRSDKIKVQAVSYTNCRNNATRSGWDIPIQRPHQTTIVELHIESTTTRYLPEVPATQWNFYHDYHSVIGRNAVIDWELLGQLVALCDAKQYAPAKLEHNQAVVKTILDSLAVFQTNLIQFEQTKQLLPHISWGRSYIEVWRQLVEHTIIVLQSSTQQVVDLQTKTNQIFANARQKLITIDAEARQLPLEDYRKIYQLSGNLFQTGILVPWLEQEIQALYDCTPLGFAKSIKTVWE